MDPERDRSFFRQILREFFDAEAIGQFVLGRFLSQATLQEIREYLELFENQYLHLFYFTSYRLKSLTIQSVQKIKDGDRAGWLVGSQISRFQGAPLTVGWVVLQTSEGLRIFDMQINGYSFKIQQREDYGA